MVESAGRRLMSENEGESLLLVELNRYTIPAHATQSRNLFREKEAQVTSVMAP